MQLYAKIACLYLFLKSSISTWLCRFDSENEIFKTKRNGVCREIADKLLKLRSLEVIM